MVTDVYQFARLQVMTEWWHWLVLLLVCAGVLAYVVAMYRRDSVELPRSLSWLLTALRLLAFVGILFFFFNLEKRTVRQLVKNSRVVLLVDTSQSMGLRDTESPGAAEGPPRIQRVVEELSRGTLLADLRAKHDVVVYRFDQDPRPVEVASLPRVVPVASEDSGVDERDAERRSLREMRSMLLIGLSLFGAAAVLAVVYVVVSRRAATGRDSTSWSLLGCVVLLIVGLVVLAVGNLRNPRVGLLALVGLGRTVPVAPPDAARPGETPAADEQPINWPEQLKARGLRTRLGDALRFVINRERGGPVAGIVLFSDGRENEGSEYTVGGGLARLAEIPVYTVGLGSEQRPANVRVVDIEAPERVYPGDRFTLTAYIQANGIGSHTAEVRLTSAPTGATGAEKAETLEQETRTELGADGEVVPVKFEITPDQPGRRTYRVTVKPPPRDQDPRDNTKAANIEVVERKTKILLIAGGPAREYCFLRNMLYRDEAVTVDVWLQSGRPGISQESNQLLFEFPETPEELFEYDCIVAFDPDWSELDVLQVKSLEQWVAEKAGGLIVIAGPVYTPQWSDIRRGDSRLEAIRTLYPVVLYSTGTANLGLGRFGGERPWQLQFTREGEEAEFLRLEDAPLESQAAWATFEGVYGYYAVKDPKPGARVYARFSDPSTAIDGQLPIYMAGQFYGAGRVFFQASGEMWRVRAVDEAYFERYYTKLIRWVSQGRLARDSNLGLLLVDKDRCLLGETVAVQAVLADSQNRPLAAPEVTASLVQPDGSRTTFVLRAVKGAAREGSYAGQFPAALEGDYRVELKPPHGDVDQLLVREVRVRVEDLEIARPERNDPLLLDLARTTGGNYYVGMDAATGRASGMAPLASVLPAQDQVSYLAGTPDRDFDRRLMGWLMALICGVLSLEWTLRRLSRLA
jgi:FtsH-binding integral membrane protein